MIFRRTSAGLSNMYLFHGGAEAVVFVEGGGRSFSFEEVVNGFYSKDSLDILFWRSVFQVGLTHRQFAFRAIGSKLTLASIASEISVGSVSRVLVCMDRDFDNVLGSRIMAKGVLYTGGYSWENDVWSPDVVLEVLDAILPERLSAVTRNAVVRNYEEFLSDVRRCVKMDILLHVSNNATVLRSAPPESFLILKTSAYPKFNRSRARALARKLCQARLGKFRLLQQYELDCQRDCYGHLLATYAYRLISAVLAQSQVKPTLPKYYASTSAIAHFARSLKHAPSLWQHYLDQLAPL